MSNQLEPYIFLWFE